MPKKDKAGGPRTSGLSVDNMPSVFPRGRRTLADFLLGETSPISPCTTAMRIEIATDLEGRSHLVVLLQAEQVPPELVVGAVPRVGICLKRSALWFIVVRGAAMAMTPMSTGLAGTQWSSEASALLACRQPGLLLVVVRAGTIERLTPMNAHARWWKGLKHWISLLPACSLERFIEHTRADGAFMGATASVGSPVLFANDGELHLF